MQTQLKLDGIEYYKEWNDTEHERVNKVIKTFLLSRKFESNKHPHTFVYCRTFKQVDQICNFTYTSSSEHAGLFVTGIELYFDVNKQWHINGFAMDIKGWIYVQCFDNENNELIFPIG